MRALICLLLACALGAAPCGAAVELRPVGAIGAYLGFDLVVDGRVIAPVRFSSNGLIVADTLGMRSRADGAQTLRFTDLHGQPGSGLTLAPDDAVTVVRRDGDPYPQIHFRLTLRGFDADAWQRAAGGPCPFHFLTIAMPRAEAWHQRGWLNATPLADPFPLLEDVHVGSPEIASGYSRNWGYTPPLGAQPMPVIGLWAPAQRLYVGLEFQGTRLRDNSEKDIATGYCWKQGADAQFVALVYPHGGKGYQSLVFPKVGDAIASHAALLYNTDLPATADPNRFVWQVIWSRDRDYLPSSPASNDLSWIAGGARLNDFERPPGPDLVGGVEGGFQVKGSRLIIAWDRHKEGAIGNVLRHDAGPGIARLTEDLRYLLTRMKRFRVDGDACVYWEKPLQGRWTDEWGGAPVTTLHNSDGFYAARVLLDLYRARETTVGNRIVYDLGLTSERLLEIVEGCFNWARHIVFTRNEFADVPSSPFAIGGTLTSAFCLDYYFAFRDDPGRRGRAEQALDLARSFVYRYLTMWPSDNDRSDRFDSAFLWEPNSGRDWCGAACSNEVAWCLDTLAMVAVNTGDPVLIHALRGSLDRWHLLYKERYHKSLAEYESDALTEGYALYDDTVYGERGTRAPWGWGPSLPMLEPVGDSTIRVLAGEKAALAFTQNAVAAEITDYNGTAVRFTISCSPPGPHDLTLTVPFSDLSDPAAASVVIRRGGRLLYPKVRRPPQALWSLYVNGVRSGDTICLKPGSVGQVSQSAKAAPPSQATKPLSLIGRGQGEGGKSRPATLSSVLSLEGRGALPASPFQPLQLPGAQPVRQHWDDLSSWAGLPGGLRWAYGVPLRLGPQPRVISTPARLAKALTGPAVILLAYSEGEGALPSITLADGTAVSVDADREALAWQAWPPIFTRRLLIAPAAIPAGKTATAIAPGSRLVFAATASRGAVESQRVMRLLSDGASQWRAMQQAERKMASLRSLGQSRRLSSLALLPYGDIGGRLASLLGRSRLLTGVTRLTPEQLIQPDVLAPSRCAALLDLDGEQYIKTVRTEGDAAAAVLDYVGKGGFLVLACDGPYPMFYGKTPQGAPSDPLLPKMGLNIKSFEKPPEGEKITLALNPDLTHLVDLPAAVAFPTDDQRLRAVDRASLPAGATYTPIYTARGAAGADYGEAACLVQLPRGGRVLYIWFGLMRDPQAGPAIAEALLRYLLEALPPVQK